MSDSAPTPISSLVIVTSGYPSASHPSYGTFVQQFAHAVARQGVACTVIQPVIWHRSWRDSSLPYHSLESAGGGHEVEVFRPRFLSLSAREGFRWLGFLNPSLFTLDQFTRAVRRVMRKHALRPAALYGHFLYMAGATAVQMGREHGIPAFPCMGEGELWTVRRFGIKMARADLLGASGFLANSSALKRMLVTELGLPSEKIESFPNGTDLSTFSPQDRHAARAKLGLPQDKFLVGAVGNFLAKKGIVRVGEAIEGLEGVAGVFAGSGPVPPSASNMALCRRVPHADIPALLSACDVFVLPTQVEGCCNAIVEAMACGLPIISSTGDFNDDILTPEMSIRVDPMDVGAIRSAIIQLRDNPDLRSRMAVASLRHSKLLDVNDRARRILAFMSKNQQHVSSK